MSIGIMSTIMMTLTLKKILLQLFKTLLLVHLIKPTSHLSILQHILYKLNKPVHKRLYITRLHIIHELRYTHKPFPEIIEQHRIIFYDPEGVVYLLSELFNILRIMDIEIDRFVGLVSLY